MNPLCNYLHLLVINYCLIEDVTTLAPQRAPIAQFQPEFRWQFINFTWTSATSYRNALTKGLYIPQNCAISGIKYYKNQLYFSLPQLRGGIPATLAALPLDNTPTFNALLRPYPSWEKNVKPRDCTTLQSVQSMEIDPEGVMWVLDGVRTTNRTKCPPKLILLDLNNHGRVLHSYIFPDEVCLTQGGYLNDLVVDTTDGGYAYITDSGSIDPGLIVYSRELDRAWKLRDSSMFPDEDAGAYVVNNVPVYFLDPIDGIALSPTDKHTGSKHLFYCSLTGDSLFTIDTRILKDLDLFESGEWRRSVRLVGHKQGATDGMMVDETGILYYTLISLNGIGRWDTNSPFYQSEVLAQNEDMTWPDSFGFDDKGYLRVLVDNMEKIFNTSYPLQLSNNVVFTIYKYYTGTRSYLYGD